MVSEKITHVIFDMDGLLLDTEGYYTEVQTEILQRYGKDFTWELKAKMMGKKALEAAQVCVTELGLQDQLTAESFLAEREEALDKLFPQTALMPGAERLLRHLHAQGVPFCLATSSHQRHFQLKTTQHRQLFSLFQHCITGDQVKNGKPAPEIFLRAAKAFSPPAEPGCCLVFEDAVAGVAAGKAAGMHVVMVPDPNLSSSAAAAADEVLESLEDFEPQNWGLPAFGIAEQGHC